MARARGQYHRHFGLFGSYSLAADLIASPAEEAQARLSANPQELAGLDAVQSSPSRTDQISGAVAMRLVLARLMPDAELVRYIEQLQDRYLTVVGPQTYARYTAGIPQRLFQDRELMDAEVRTISYRLRLAYCFTAVRDQRLAVIRQTCAGSLIAMLLICFCIVIFESVNGTTVALNYIIVACLGTAGASTSIARRANQLVLSQPLQVDPVIQTSAFDQGLGSLFVAALCGPVFSLLLLVVFLSTAFNVGGLTPAFLLVAPVPKTGADFQLFAHSYWIRDGLSAALIGIWAFVAGFAEQLVPDVLDRFTSARPQPPKAVSDNGSLAQ